MVWNILNAVIPFFFHIPAIVKLKEKVEQSLKPVKMTPKPIKYLLWYLYPKNIIPTEIINKVFTIIIQIGVFFIFLESKLIASPPKN